MKKRIIIISVAAAVLLVIGIAVLIINLSVVLGTKDRVFSERDIGTDRLLGEYDCILILGAGLRRDGSPSDMLEDRLKVGIGAYLGGASDRILMSGDHENDDYNEVGAMKKYAVEQGIDGGVIFLDHFGLSTYDSIFRAVKLYGVKRVLIVSQSYHLYRALYIADSLGIEADGISADLRTYRVQLKCDVRELAARVKDVIYVAGKHEPMYFGEPVDLSGDGDSTNERPILEG